MIAADQVFVEDLVVGDLLQTDESMPLWGHGLPPRVRVEAIHTRRATDGSTFYLLTVDEGIRCPVAAQSFLAVLRWR